jgi:hypothetical protein
LANATGDLKIGFCLDFESIYGLIGFLWKWICHRWFKCWFFLKKYVKDCRVMFNCVKDYVIWVILRSNWR